MIRPAAEQGFALILALWSVALCAAAAGYGLQQALRLSADLTVQLEITRAEMALSAGEALARDAIRNAGRTGDNPAGRRRIAHEGFDVLIAIEDEALKLNPNDAEPASLAAALRDLGAGAAAADAMSERIADFLDRDDQERSKGAEAPRYRRAGTAPPKNAPIRHLAELWGVLGFADFIDRLGPDVDISTNLTLRARGKGRYDPDRRSDAQFMADASQEPASGPFRVRLKAERREGYPASANGPSVSRSRTLIVTGPLR